METTTLIAGLVVLAIVTTSIRVWSAKREIRKREGGKAYLRQQ